MVNDEEFDLIYESISVKHAVEIDFKSYGKNGFSSFFEMRNIIDFLKIQLFKNQELFYDSENPNKILEFNLVKKIYDEIKNAFYLSEEELENFENDCVEFLKDESYDKKMPYELLLAKNIFNGLLTINLSDFENMDIKKYEKIQIALSILKKQVESQEID